MSSFTIQNSLLDSLSEAGVNPGLNNEVDVNDK